MSNSPLELVCHDPLAEFLGAGDGYFRYTFADVVKLSGHSCPTVAGAFLMVLRAASRLWPDQPSERGGWRITIHGGVLEGGVGPISQVFTLLTGAAADNGFHGLGGQFVRRGQLIFCPESRAGHFTFQRLATGQQLSLRYQPNAILAPSGLSEALGALLSGAADADTALWFRRNWQDRVAAILADEGESTLVEL